jgi:pectin methylesterase-like acyl-CoA thioesterase
MVKNILSKSFVGLIMILVVQALQAQTKVFDKIIATDGTGDYVSVATAISMYSNSRKVFFVKNGTYNEKILIDATKTNIRLIGESVNGVIITYNDYAGKSGTSSSTAESYTVRVEGNGFYAENITFQNTATQAQAVAIYTKADTIAFKNCRFYGYQDTHYADNGRQYFLNCETRGDVDFIFGNAAAMYDKSTIISRSRQGGYVTAPSTTVLTSVKQGGGTDYHGLVIKNSELKAEKGLADNSCYLGRPWGGNGSSVFLNCKIGSHIKPAGWLADAGTDYLTVHFAEFNNTDSLGNSINTAQRVTWSNQLTTSDTSLYNLNNFFLGWNPTLKTTALPVPTNVRILGDSLKWNAISGARGYAILRNDSVIGFSTITGFSITGKLNQNYRIKSVNQFGALSDASSLAILTNNVTLEEKNPKTHIYVSNDVLYVPENEKTEIYNITGMLVKATLLKRTISTSTLNNGVYIVKVTLDKKGSTITQKIYK